MYLKTVYYTEDVKMKINDTTEQQDTVYYIRFHMRVTVLVY